MARILVVEDERSIRQALCFELEDEGHTVHQVSNYAEASCALNVFDFDLIISDLLLGDGDATQLMWQTKNKNVPFIVMTAFADSELARRVQSVLKGRFFEKPFFIDRLKDKVYESLSHKMAELSPVIQKA